MSEILVAVAPRSLHRFYARARGYFWLPCERCGFEFGGHEAGWQPKRGFRIALLCPGCVGVAEVLRRAHDKRTAAEATSDSRSASCPKCGVEVTDQTPSSFYLSHDERCGGDLSEPSTTGSEQ